MMWRNEVLILPKAMQRVKQIVDESKAKEAAVTIAAVQPTLMADRENGEQSSQLNRSSDNYYS
jgi:hypothetical protein